MCQRNTYLANMELIKLYSDDSQVSLSWFNASIDTYEELGSDVHPIDDGYKTLGTQMYSLLRTIN